ncbi:MAG: hypothetical protein IH984_11890 [Planctomycetes bacterium]|nr:hypothetical protein [Planctomycetota bacterium]
MRQSIFAACCLVSNTVFADTINVPADYPTIQGAILAALEGDEIVVSPGIYSEAIFFNGNVITLRSEQGPEVTTIDATGTGLSAIRAVSGELLATTLEGFTITGGVFGGIQCTQSALTIKDCIISGNTGNSGGGIFVGGSLSAAKIIACQIIDNEANQDGGGVYSISSDIEIIDSFISTNTAGANGGGVRFVSVSSANITNSLIVNNQAASYGGIQISGGALNITNCTIAGNTAQFQGGFNLLGTGNATNIIVWGNGLMPFSSSDNINLSHSNIEFGWPGCDFCILADPMFVDPENGDYRLGKGSPCIDLGLNAALPKGMLFDLDGLPRFIDDPNTADCPQPGADCGTAPIVDLGAYEFQGLICPWDLDGSGSVGTRDLLMLFAQWGTDGPADFNGSGAIDTADLLILFANWGPCP